MSDREEPRDREGEFACRTTLGPTRKYCLVHRGIHRDSESGKERHKQLCCDRVLVTRRSMHVNCWSPRERLQH